MNFLYLVVTIANFVIPLMGRVGIRENTEGAIAFLTIFVLHSGTAFIWPKVVPFSKKTIQITCILFLAATVFFISVLTTDLVGLPYSEDPKSIAPKRLTVLHTERKKFIEAKIEASESGISIEDHDIR